ncbi:glutathione S-transferase [Luteibacter rhizovicinus]|uniref:Glutathione S-transferase n=1 Tax=Luteibacter rhizovicinus TaxID=242606 RepID=A0A4R3YYF0_9GAMM|nr:glutathione S-transferase family protein [Luteibacter rhizovicinus]TCV97680.1 glutathione S-transferase [Luteibacter rhizovicinus]
MIDLYKLHWSHYVEKVRWALDFKKLPWRGIDIVAFTKKEMRHFDCPQTVPLINDTETGIAISDSSPIIRYLDETYPEHPLFPSDPVERDQVWQWMLRLDSTLGLYARRLGYTQLIMECPQILAQLFVPDVLGGLFARRGWRTVASPVLGTMLILRFHFHRNRHDRIYEKLEALLTPIAEKLGRDGFLAGTQFTAADLTLASLLRPLRIVPHFSHHPQLQSLFVWQERLFREYGRDVAFPYEEAIRAKRERSGLMRSRVSWMKKGPEATGDYDHDALLHTAKNDLHPVSSKTLVLGLPAYFKLRWFNGIAKATYTPAPYVAHGIGGLV